jgi:hypothetical protein
MLPSRLEYSQSVFEKNLGPLGLAGSEVVGLAMETAAGRAVVTAAENVAVKVLEEAGFSRLAAPAVTGTAKRDLGALLADADKSYLAQDWTASRSLYGQVQDLTGGSEKLYWKNYVAQGRLAQANFELGDLPTAEAGLKRFLAKPGNYSPLQGQNYERLATIFEQTGRGSRAPILRANAQGILTELPDYSKIATPLKVPKGYATSEEAFAQVQQFEDTDILKQPLVPGFYDYGEMLYSGKNIPPKTVIDISCDPALAAAAAKIDSSFSNLTGSPAEYATALTRYTGKLFNKPDIGSSAPYQAFRKANVGQEFFLGDFLCRGSGMCNQQGLFLKTIADRAGMQATLYRGSVGGDHMFDTIMINGKEKLFDSALGNIGSDFARYRGKSYTATSWNGLWEAPA